MKINENKKHIISPQEAVELVNKALERANNKFFNTRIKFCEELIEYLRIDKTFEEKIVAVREKYEIPELSPEEDLHDIVIDEGRSIEESLWMWSLDKKTRESFRKDVNEIIQKYKLPSIFYRWLECFVLYKQELPMALYNSFWALPLYILDPIELKKYPLTTQDKNYIKYFLRSEFDIKRRPKKEKARQYRRILQELQKLPKNKKRRFRTIETALKTLERGEIITHHDWDGKDESHKKTYQDLAVEIDEEGKYFGKEKQLAQRLRKQNQRLRERLIGIFGKNNFKK